MPYTAEDLARIALERTGSNPRRTPRSGDTAAAVKYVATQALEEMPDHTLEDAKLLWETVLVLANREPSLGASLVDLAD